MTFGFVEFGSPEPQKPWVLIGDESQAPARGTGETVATMDQSGHELALVDVSPMTQGDDNDQEDVVLDRVDHAVAARPDAECVAPLELLDIRWTRIFRQQGYGPLDPSSDLGI